MQNSRLGSWRGRRLICLTEKRSSCRRGRPVHCRFQVSSHLSFPEQETSFPNERVGHLDSSIERLDKALAEKDVDASWSLMVDLLPSTGSVAQLDASLKDIIDRRPKVFLEECLEMQRSDLVFAFFRHFPLDRYLFGAALKRCLRLRQYTHVSELMALHSSLGGVPDAHAFNAHISALSKLGRIDEARRVFDAAVEAGQDSIYVYNTMMDAYARIGRVEEAEEIWMKLKHAGLEPDAVSYVGMLRAWGNQANFDKFRELYAELRSKGLKPMPHTFTVLFDSITKRAASVNVRWLIGMVASMKQEDIPINQHILSAMINAFSLQHLDAEQLQFVFSTVVEFSQETSPGNSVYSILLKFCCRQGVPERARDVWKMIKADGITPNGHVYSAVLKACGAMKLKQRGWRFVSEIAEELKINWQTMEDKESAKDTMRAAFNALLHFYAETKNVEDALCTYASMQQDGPFPDRITYNTLLSVLSSCGDSSQIQRVMEDMRMADCSMDLATYGILLNRCADRRDVAGAMALIEEMQQKEMQPTVECYTSVLDALVKEGSEASLAQAFDLFQELKQQKLQPTVVTYGCLFQAYQATENVDGAFALYKEACRCGVSPSDRCHNVLISMCTDVGRLDDALKLIKVLVRKHGDIAEDTMNSITRALSAEYLPRSLVLLRMMKSRSMVPSLETFNCLILACCRESDSQHAFSLYKEMIGQRLLVRPEAASALITSLSKAGDVLAATRVTNYMFEKAGLPSIDSSRINQGWKPSPSRRKERIVYSSLPTVLSLGSLIVALVQKSQLQTAMYIFRQISVLNNGSGIMLLAKDICQVFELLIESSCSGKRVDWAIEVFLKWSIATKKIIRTTSPQKRDAKIPKISLASLAFLHATCKRTLSYETYIWQICEAMKQQEELKKVISPRRTLHP